MFKLRRISELLARGPVATVLVFLVVGCLGVLELGAPRVTNAISGTAMHLTEVGHAQLIGAERGMTFFVERSGPAAASIWAVRSSRHGVTVRHWDLEPGQQGAVDPSQLVSISVRAEALSMDFSGRSAFLLTAAPDRGEL